MPRVTAVFLCLLLFSQTTKGQSAPEIEDITPSVRVFRDAVNVGVIQRNGKLLLIGSGDAGIIEWAREHKLGSIEWVLYTDHHRDQAAGAARLRRAGAKIAVPAREAQFFAKATEFWLDSDRRIDHRYNFRPDHFVLRESVPVDRILTPGESFHWEGLEIQVLPTPGPTDGSVSYMVDVDDRRVVFSGDLIHGPGQLWEFYSLQKRFPGMPLDYWGFGGGVSDVLESLDRLISLAPQVLIPSHGVVMSEPAAAVQLLRERLQAAMTNYLSLAGWRFLAKREKVQLGVEAPMLDPMPPAALPPWLHRVGDTSWYIQSSDGSIFLFDAGPQKPVEELGRLFNEKKISALDAIWISHYHDDHVESVNWFRHMNRARVYAQAEIADILRHPQAYTMPALSGQPVQIDHVLAEGETIAWKEYKLTGYYFPGQTLYHAALLIERDGVRVLHVGDSFNNWGISDHTSHNRNFLRKGQGYLRCLNLLLQLNPDVLLGSHTGALPVSRQYVAETITRLEERGRLFAAIFPWDDPNFGLDPYWIRAYPYRQSALPGSTITIEARVYNHSPHTRRVSVELRIPSGWTLQNASGAADIAGHSEGVVRLMATTPAQPLQRREVVGLAVRFDGRNLGEFAEAIVDYLGQ